MDVLGGYRIVRTLGRGSRADVFLGYAGENPATARTAAIKVFRATTTIESIDVEIEALARAAHRHLVRLDDLFTAADGRPALVLGRLGPATLSTLLLDRGELTVGEAVTILAPICLAVAELHRVGVAHRRLRTGCVGFDAFGAPVLTGFGHAELVGGMPEREPDASLNPAELAESSGVITDLVQLSALVRTVLEVTPPSRSASTLIERLRSAETCDAAEVADRVFDLAPALPIDFAAPRPVQVRRPVSPVVDDVVPSTPAWLSALPLPDWPVLERAGPVLGSALASLKSVRRPVWFAAVGSAALLVAALALVPAGASTSAATPDTEGPSASAPAGPAASAQGGVDSAGSGAGQGGPAASMDSTAAAIAADDPVAAARALLSLRSACFAERSVLCLDGVDYRDSAAIEADGYRIRELQEGAPPENTLLSGEAGNDDGTIVTLVQRLGDSALLSVARAAPLPDEAPASVLLVKGGDGWRIRDLIVG